jgi:hypothetical protein
VPDDDLVERGARAVDRHRVQAVHPGAAKKQLDSVRQWQYGAAIGYEQPIDLTEQSYAFLLVATRTCLVEQGSDLLVAEDRKAGEHGE